MLYQNFSNTSPSPLMKSRNLFCQKKFFFIFFFVTKFSSNIFCIFFSKFFHPILFFFLFPNWFLLQNLVTFARQKIKKIFFLEKNNWRIVFEILFFELPQYNPPLVKTMNLCVMKGTCIGEIVVLLFIQKGLIRESKRDR